MSIKAFGYTVAPWDANRPAALSEVTFVAAPDVLRRVAQHLLQAAAELERHPDPPFDHLHLQDEWDDWSDEDVDVIVASPRRRKQGAPDQRMRDAPGP